MHSIGIATVLNLSGVARDAHLPLVVRKNCWRKRPQIIERTESHYSDPTLCCLPAQAFRPRIRSSESEV
jgi:hypothetical protein